MIRLGMIGGADIAFEKFLPALMKQRKMEAAAVAVRNTATTRAERFREEFDIKVIEGYDRLFSEDIDAVYISLPPALHYPWAKKALNEGKHVLLEKPSTTSLQLTTELVELAKKKELALHENYMFQYHRQIESIKELLRNDTLGELRAVTARFGFPLKKADDFRYQTALGGGALFDAGGYILKMADLIDQSFRVTAASAGYIDGFEVDMFGSITMENDRGVSFYGAFGFDNNYECSLDIWGSRQRLRTERIFTAPAHFKPELILMQQQNIRVIEIEEQDHFLSSIHAFVHQMEDATSRECSYTAILKQSRNVEDARRFQQRRCPMTMND